MDVSSGRGSVRLCKKCGREFFDPRGARAMCFECHKRKKKPTFTEEKACAVCGEGFIPRSANHAFCSEGCFAMRFGTATCPTCGKGFVRVRKGQMHCSNECAIEARHEASKRPCPVCGGIMSYREDKKNAYCSKECRDKALAHMVVCAVCGKEFKGRMHHRQRQKYCSRECQFKAQKKREDQVCIQCGKVFHPHSMAKGLYCSHECSGIALRTNMCAVCGKWVPSGRRFCSEKCRAVWAWDLKTPGEQFDDMVEWMCRLSKAIAGRERTLIAVGCEQCGKGFVTTSKTARYCSDRCRKRHANRLKDRRVYRNGIPDGSITLEKLFVRDGGRCRMCGLLMTFDCDPNSDAYPSIDHIVPLSRGGLHQWPNVQLMCRGCNSDKTDRLLPSRGALATAWF